MVTDATKVEVTDAKVTINDDANTNIHATELSAIGAKTSGVVTVENAVHITGDHEEVTDALVTDATKVEVTDAKVTINDDADTNIHATELSAIGAKTSGVVTVENAVHITGDHEEVTDALVTDATKVEVTDAKVTINDDANTNIHATELSAIGAKTSSVVTVENDVHITGDHEQVTAALVTDATKVVADTALVTINDDANTNIHATELSAIGGKTDGTVTVSYAVHISGTPAEVTDALVTDATKVEVTGAKVTIDDTQVYQN